MRAHLPAENLRAEEVAGQIDRENGVPFGKRQTVEPAGTQHRGGIDQHIARPQRFFDRRGCRGDALDISRIAAGDDLVGAELGEFFARYIKAALIAIDRGDTGAGPSEADGHGAADAATATRHHADAAGQAEPIGRFLFGHGFLLRCCERRRERSRESWDSRAQSFRAHEAILHGRIASLAMTGFVTPRSPPPPGRAAVPGCAACWRMLRRPRCP